MLTVFHLNIAHIEDSYDVFAFWHNDQYITYLLLTCVSFQNCHLLKVRHMLALVLVFIRFGNEVNRSLLNL